MGPEYITELRAKGFTARERDPGILSMDIQSLAERGNGGVVVGQQRPLLLLWGFNWLLYHWFLLEWNIGA